MKNFATTRLAVTDWTPTLSDPKARADLEAELAGILTPRVLRNLPEPLQLTKSGEAISDWTSARAAEGNVLLVENNATKELVGLLILALATEASGERRCHIGYLLAERAWGMGYATELITGVVEALKSDAPVTLLGGVDIENVASARVLEKAGFRKEATLSNEETSIFVLDLR